LGLGVLLAAGLIVQHLGLDRTSEAVSAFLTSLTILFVPILVTLTARRPPRGVLWLGVVIAVAGVWMMTGAQPSGFGSGEILGLACSLAFAIYILAVNAIVPNDSPWRMTGGQFLVVGVICMVWAMISPGGSNAYQPAVLWRVMLAPDVTLNVLLLTVFATIGAFGLLTHFQPFVEPTRAALIYLFEPVVATIWAAVAAGHGIGRIALIGAALILAANVLVEILTSHTAGSWVNDRQQAI
jgi:drug/metabolite transporter (DMT)-like permease